MTSILGWSVAGRATMSTPRFSSEGNANTTLFPLSFFFFDPASSCSATCDIEGGGASEGGETTVSTPWCRPHHTLSVLLVLLRAMPFCRRSWCFLLISRWSIQRRRDNSVISAKLEVDRCKHHTFFSFFFERFVGETSDSSWSGRALGGKHVLLQPDLNPGLFIYPTVVKLAVPLE